MTFDSEPNEASRKTLDEIRRELDAEYGYVEVADATGDAPEAAPEPPPRPARPQPRMPAAWSERDDVDDTLEPSFRDFRAIADRHELPLGRRRDVAEDRPRRSGYLIAGLVGCIVGQVVLLAFFMVTWRGGSVTDMIGKIAALRTRSEAPAPAARPVADDAQQPAAEPPPQAEASAPSSPPAPEVASAPAPPESKPEGSDAPPPIAAPEPRASSSPQSATVSSATVIDGSTSRPSADLPPRVARESRASSARPPVVAASAQDWAEAQARLRSTLNQWLKASSRGGTSVPAAEPVIVLNADGRTAKTYVSMVSPVGLVPREQRWELGPRGWNLVDDRQAGLPRPISSRER